MDSHANSEFFSLAEEKFDFDVSLSPASSREEDDDEVFVGPIRHKERCISVGLQTIVKEYVNSGSPVVEEASWSPLPGEKFEEICKEAHLLASQLEVSKQQQPCREVNGPLTVVDEDFVQDAGAKLGVLDKPVNAVISPIKRETFCIQDSPLKQLPPAIQQRLTRASGASNSAKGRVNTSSPLRSGTMSQPKIVLRGRAGLACNTGVLPSKLRPAARGASVTSALHVAKTRAPAERTAMLPPSRKGNLGLRRSPGSQNSSRATSTEELFSDTASVASDVSDSSLDSSLQGRRTLLPIGRSGLRAPSTANAPEPQNRRVLDRRRNTSSSSSSVSSLNSSMSVSPTGKGKVNTSLNSSTIGSNSRPAPGISRLPNHTVSASKSCKSALATRVGEPLSTAGARRSFSVQGRKPSEPTRSKPVRSTPMKKAELASTATPLQQTPAKRNMERTSSVPNIPTSSLAKVERVRGNPKLKGLIAPTPTSQFKRRSEVLSSSDAPRIMNPKRLMSACSMESPHKPALPFPEPLRTPSAGGSKALQPKRRPPSALPTPVNRRVSGIPMLTPKSITHPGRTSLITASTRRASYRSPAPVKGNLQEGVEAAPEEETIQPFCLEEEPEIRPANTELPEEPEVSPSVPEPGTEDQEPPAISMDNPYSEPQEESMELQVVEPPQGNGMKARDVNEVMLVDAPVPVLRPKEKLLIDLTNTPDLIRTASLKTSGGQLIDLSSPLIKWSPEDKNQQSNDAPLINLSF